MCPIDNPSYNLPYEKVGKNELVCIADEVPFEIPDSWEWVRFGCIINLQSGQDLTPDKYNDHGKGIPYITGASNIEEGKVIINRWTEYGRAFAYKNELLLTCKGTVGTMAFLNEEIVHIARQIMAIHPYDGIDSNYVRVVLESLVEGLKAAAKSMIPGISREDVLTALFPLPPINEQMRIVNKIFELEPLIDSYNSREQALSSLNHVFPETLKKSILQQAVMGKLAPQDPNDEPASVLLERIRAEKQELIKDGKLKKDKHESIIYRRDNSHYEKLDGIVRCIDDEIPFDIPSGWIWSRLKSLGITQTGNTPSKAHPEYFGKDIPFIGPGDIQNSAINYKNQGLSTIGKEVGRVSSEGSILQVCIGGSIGKAAITDKEITFNQQINAIAPLIVDNIYLFYMMTAPYSIEFIKHTAGGTATPIINRGSWDNLLIPVAPLEEQIRIVTQINDAFRICNNL